ncbi:Helix-turn-helix domain-containing protein [Paenibacillus sp. 1_12]|uniref:response regulator transcription factor n=1 Tax=Paenibacillus sp. 1_12 TaxID=1566278 RepID=UPI0008E617D8|nr:response regulator [Paenibacillus sp. 1_12]SFM45978.1 Helix-turn-helix domain-containing protein [Paenibacillus sp. 1_12]
MLKLMIVDDEPYILEGLAKIVREAGTPFTRIEEALDAVEATEKMKDFVPDVTITDLNMPEISGFELIEEAKRLGYCNRFIILTGYDKFDYARKAIRTGVIDYLLKPINRDEIIALLQSIALEIETTHKIADHSEYGRHMDKILHFIEDHYDNSLSLEDLACHTGLHPNYISGLFRKETGLTFVNYLNSLRIDKARKLLETKPHVPVNTIGQQVGFDSPQHFTKVFKKYTGITPGYYRLAEDNDNERGVRMDPS